MNGYPERDAIFLRRWRRCDGAFERWRQTREPYARVPDPLWAAAARLAAKYGLSRTASALGVNYQALKKRLAARTRDGDQAVAKGMLREAAPARGGPEREGVAQFVELAAFASAATDARSAPGECLLEWEDGEGAKMRICLRGVGMPDLPALGRSFWDRRP